MLRGKYEKLQDKQYQAVSDSGKVTDVTEDKYLIPVKSVSMARGPARFDGRELHATAKWDGTRIACIAYPLSICEYMRSGAQKILESYGYERLYEAYAMEMKQKEQRRSGVGKKKKKVKKGKGKKRKNLKK